MIKYIIAIIMFNGYEISALHIPLVLNPNAQNPHDIIIAAKVFKLPQDRYHIELETYSGKILMHGLVPTVPINNRQFARELYDTAGVALQYNL